MTTLDEIEAAARASAAHEFPMTEIHNSTILALTADLRACKEALGKIHEIGSQESVSQKEFDGVFSVADQALQNLKKKWGL